jgi:phage/plasmid-like protein (TIGR03299 family)
MAHHFESGFFAERAAWHGLGKVLRLNELPATTAGALVLGGADWDVRAEPIMLVADHLSPSPDRHGHRDLPGQCIIRGDTGEALAVVGESYSAFQNLDLAPILDPLLETGRWRFDTFCALKGGRIVLCTLVDERSDPLVVKGDDVLTQRLLVSTTHDGSGLVRVRPTAIRVVCWNTYSVALGERQPEARIRHSGNPQARARAIGSALAQGEAELANTIRFLGD